MYLLEISNNKFSGRLDAADTARGAQKNNYFVNFTLYLTNHTYLNGTFLHNYIVGNLLGLFVQLIIFAGRLDSLWTTKILEMPFSFVKLQELKKSSK